MKAGRYIASSLEVGMYEVRAEKEGFSAEIRTGITLAVGQQAEVDLTLRVGQLQDAVVVTEDSPVVSVTTRDISGLVGERQMKDLPLNGRSYDQFTHLKSRDRELYVAAFRRNRNIQLGCRKHVLDFGPPASKRISTC